MKKLLGIVVLGLLWCNIVSALSQQSVTDQYLSGRKLDLVEGIWITHRGGIHAIYKNGNSYSIAVIEDEYFRNGQILGHLTKGSSNTFYGNQEWWIVNDYNVTFKSSNYKVTFRISGNVGYLKASGAYGSGDRTYQRMWPENTNSHNAKLDGKKESNQSDRKSVV